MHNLGGFVASDAGAFSVVVFLSPLPCFDNDINLGGVLKRFPDRRVSTIVTLLMEQDNIMPTEKNDKCFLLNFIYS